MFYVLLLCFSVFLYLFIFFVFTFYFTQTTVEIWVNTSLSPAMNKILVQLQSNINGVLDEIEKVVNAEIHTIALYLFGTSFSSFVL